MKKENCNKCNEVFDIFGLNANEKTRDAFTQKITSYLADTMQTSNFIAEEITKKIEEIK